MCLAQRIETHNKILLNEVHSMMILVTPTQNPSISSFFFLVVVGWQKTWQVTFGNDKDNELITICSDTYL
jgi:hypothetical protein